MPTRMTTCPTKCLIRRSPARRAAWGAGLLMVALAGSALIGGCNRNQKPTPRARSVDPIVTRDIPTPLRGTVGSIARLRGVNATRASGIGFVVGLNGTGGQPLQEQIAAHLEREMALNGIGQAGKYEGTAIAGTSPRALLNDRNTAAVIVEAALPPGLAEGEPFDVYVRALNATSLEGGILWTTELRAGPPSAFGTQQARKVGEARGPLFINPFAEPGAEGDGVTRTTGRILEGGVMHEDLFIDVVLDNPSHARARQIVSAINSAFPRGVGDKHPPARGSDDQLIRVKVPMGYRGREGQFAELVRHTTVDTTYPEVAARRYAQTLASQPELAGAMSWCLEALGERSLPFLRDLYTSTEAIPRLAALRAGASLGDPRAAEPLTELARRGPAGVRPEAARLLGKITGGPSIELALVELLAEDDLVVRVAAYEALADRAEKAQRRRVLAYASTQPGGATARLSLASLNALSRAQLPGGTLQQVSRELVAGKFLLDRAPAGPPLIYITQQGEPRVVLFGTDDALPRPLLVSAWSDRLLLKADSPTDPIQVRYRHAVTGRTVTGTVEPTLTALIDFMAHSPSPEDPRPGLGLSYSEVVGALYEVQRQSGLAAPFATERDRLLAELLQAGERQEIEIRPETPEDQQELVLFGGMDDSRAQLVQPGQATPRRTSLLVPLAPPLDKDGKPIVQPPAPTPPPANEPAGRDE